MYDLDWRMGLGLVAGLIAFAAVIPYIRDTLRGTTRPNIVTWSLWTLNGIILSSAQYAAGASWTLAVLVASTTTTGIVALLALRWGQRQYGRIDGVCFALAILAVCAWMLTENPLMAICFSLIAEIFAAAPTVIKTYEAPETETSTTYWLAAFATILSLFASTRYDPPNVLFAIYSLGLNSLIATLAMRSVGRPSRSRNLHPHRP